MVFLNECLRIRHEYFKHNGLSGNKTEANYLKYIKVTEKERAKRIAEHKFFQLVITKNPLSDVGNY